MSDVLDPFWSALEFEPDPFQVDAGNAIAAGNSVVVTAPTGSGKTLVAEVAIYLALERGERIFYTTPIKALSNQKFTDLRLMHGDERVGLLTGDNVINGDADVVVMTTEVLRNMIYSESSRLDRVSTVVLDEVHYLQDRARGAVWEEVLIHCPKHVRMVCLSATVSNNQEFCDWVAERRGPTRLIATSHRPVPLQSMYLIKDKMGSRSLHLMPTFVDESGKHRPNQKIQNLMQMERGRRRRFKTPNRVETVERLADEGMLPAIYFIFSRAGCDAAAHRLATEGLRLTTHEERATIRSIAEQITSHLTDADLSVLDYDRWLDGLERGVGAHHAGMVPAFKETVEELFAAGLLQVVFATETLSLGINMPARTVVLESLSKFNGENHETLGPGDYTQLTGRAGRRGIDTEGFGVVLHSPYVRFATVAGIASSGSHPLRSSFRPTYNMAANLVANYGREQTETLLEASFASFQLQSHRQAGPTTIARLESQIEKDLLRATCDRGSVEEYLALIDIGRRPDRDDRLASTLKPGDVIDIPGGARDGRYAILKRLSKKDRGLRYLVMSTSGRVSTLGHREIVVGTEIVGDLPMSRGANPRDRSFIEQTKRQLRRLPPPDRTNKGGRPVAIDHPVADCPDASAHIESARRIARSRRKIRQLTSSGLRSDHGLVEEFRSIYSLLERSGYVADWRLTSRGDLLRGIYNELDLLIAMTVDGGLFDGLTPAELVALASVYVYEPRSDMASTPDWPTADLRERWTQVEMNWKDLVSTEEKMKLPTTRRPDPGFGRLAYLWAEGVEFEELATRAMAPGDFVRVSRQLTDLLRQFRDLDIGISSQAKLALKAIDRGIVAAQGVG